MEKKKIYIIFGVLLSLILILVIISKIQNSPDYRVKKNLKQLGFVGEKDSDIYTKVESDVNESNYLKLISDKKNAVYEVLYFELLKKQLTRKELKYDNGIATSFISNYDDINKKTTYTYKVSYNNSSVIFEGEYNLGDDDSYTCENIYIYEFDMSFDDSDICNKIKYDIKEFNVEAFKILKEINS